MYYKHFEISVDRFGQAPDFTGQILKIVIEDSKKMRIVFAFAVDLMSVTKYSLYLHNVSETAIDTVKSKIDLGEFEDLELTYEYQHPNFVQVNNPKWWKKANS